MDGMRTNGHKLEYIKFKLDIKGSCSSSWSDPGTVAQEGFEISILGLHVLHPSSKLDKILSSLPKLPLL